MIEYLMWSGLVTITALWSIGIYRVIRATYPYCETEEPKRTKE